ncbi:unannotated protein [freshwater metagenome]|uniref:Unannotated protein n=1 Tax=freshwater metagenome TaxID=449393 RepID=A0A6J7HAA9_9ZZZZ|nr:hypothetical protein [Actinomycetota bacterium]
MSDAEAPAPPAGLAPAERLAWHAARGEVAYTVDAGGVPVWPPQVGLDWRLSAGRGRIYTMTVMRPRGGEPRNLALIDLDEGLRIMSRVEGGPAAIGDAVSARFDDGVLVFVPA